MEMFEFYYCRTPVWEPVLLHAPAEGNTQAGVCNEGKKWFMVELANPEYGQTPALKDWAL